MDRSPNNQPDDCPPGAPGPAPCNGPPNPCGGGDPEVGRLLMAGSPRLALARAMGVPMAPTLYTIKATFSAASDTDVPDVGADNRISQDTLIDAMVYRIQNESDTANQNQFQPQSDFFFNDQSGILVKMQIQGAPRYSVAPAFTPISTFADMISGGTHWPYGWVLNNTQQPMMDFHASIPLPFAPLSVYVTLRGWIPTTDLFLAANITNRAALDELCERGYSVPKGYREYLCR